MSHTVTLSADQYFSLVMIFSFMILYLACWATKLCLPFKLLTVFMHEMGHATMAWICCGKVQSITVEENESGLTNYTYDRPYVVYWVTPAGYIGSSVIGAGLVMCGAGVLSSLVACIVLAVVLLITIVFQKNTIPRVLTACVVIVVAGLMVLYFTQIDSDALGPRLFCTFIGVMNGLYSVWDIYESTVAREAEGSDARECARICNCPNSSKKVGFVWMLISFILFVGGVFVHVLLVTPLHD